MVIKSDQVAPVLKWVGGKRQLLGALGPLIPKRFSHYCEPFFGGGAVLFALQPILHLNLLELQLLTGTTDLVAGLNQLTAKTTSPVILTLAEQGCLLAQRIGNTALVSARRSQGAIPSFNPKAQPTKAARVKNIFQQAMAQAPSLGFVLKHYPTKACTVVDATGAGDAHSAGLIAALVQGQSIDEGIILGSKLAAKAVGQVGARLTIEH